MSKNTKKVVKNTKSKEIQEPLCKLKVPNDIKSKTQTSELLTKTTPLKINSTNENLNNTDIFYAEVSKGYVPKVAFDALATNIHKIPLIISKKGISIRVADRDTPGQAHILWDVTWERKNFARGYICTKSGTIRINAKHLQKMLKNVKKKDSLIFFIKKSDENQLGIIIRPMDGTKTGGSVSRSETIYLSIEWVDLVLPTLPESYLDEGKMRNVYGDPVIVESTDFQKIKKITSVCKTNILVSIQKDNYISFRAGDEKVMSSHLEYGELLKVLDESISEESYDDSNCSEESNNCEPLIEDSEEEIQDNSTFVYPSFYKEEFDVSLFSPLIKLPGLCIQLEFYVPKIPTYPLKVSMMASSGLGSINIYIKNQKQISDMIEREKEQKLSKSAYDFNHL